MGTMRLASVDDAALIARQRRRMFEDSGQFGASVAVMDLMETNFVEWVRPRLVDGTYTGWFTEEDGVVVAAAGVWWMDFPPHFRDPEAGRAYLLNVYVEPGCRGRRLAEELLHVTMAEVKRRGIKVFSLHASPMGKSLYERNGFTGTNEMMLFG